jgi:hypothetical protein
MKKLIVIMILISTMAYASTVYLTVEWANDYKRYCQYSDGQVIAIPVYSSCPQRIQGE